MEVILKEDVTNLGHKDDLVTVKNGYARNYLIPRGIAVAATKSVRKMHDENVRQRAHKEEKMRNAAAESAEKLNEVKLTIGAKTSTKGKIFGSVNTIQIAGALKEKGFDVERKNISIKEDLIKEIGTYKAQIKLYKDVTAEIEFEIVAE